jgi:hypothetical protein
MAATSELAMYQMVIDDAFVSLMQSAVQELQTRKASGWLDTKYSELWHAAVIQELVGTTNCTLFESINKWIMNTL